MANLSLLDAMDPPKALLQAIRVPRQVVVDHQVRTLKVHALSRRVIRDQDQYLGIVHEVVDDLAPVLAVV